LVDIEETIMVDMRFIRKRTGLLATCALVWQALVLAVASVVLTCDRGLALERAGMSEHEGMVDCPMQKKEPACPLHAAKHGTRDCDCPSLGCSQADAGFMAIFGTVGVLSSGTSIDVPLGSGDAYPAISVSVTLIAPAPLSPPPRA
jgi:hypothetical protein